MRAGDEPTGAVEYLPLGEFCERSCVSWDEIHLDLMLDECFKEDDIKDGTSGKQR